MTLTGNAQHAVAMSIVTETLQIKGAIIHQSFAMCVVIGPAMNRAENIYTSN